MNQQSKKKSKETESVIKNLTKKTLGPNGFTGGFYQTFMEEPIQMFLNVFQKTREETLPNSFYEASITQITKSNKDTARKLQISLMIIAKKILNKILSRRIGSTLKGLYIMSKWNLFLEWKNGSTYKN